MTGKRGFVTLVVIVLWAMLPTAGRASGDGASGSGGCGNGGCPSGQTPCGGGCMPEGSSCCPDGQHNCPAPFACDANNACVSGGGGSSSGGGGSCAANQCMGYDGLCYGPCAQGACTTTRTSSQCSNASAGGVYCCPTGSGSSGGGSSGSGCTAQVCCGGLYECNGACYATCVVGSQPCCTATECVCYTPCC